MSYVTGSTFAGKNISTVLLLTSFTVVTPGKYTFQVYLDALAGGGDYTLNMRRKRQNVGTDYPLVPKTTYTAAAGAQGFGFPSIGVECLANDLISFYGLGLAGDTTITGTADVFMDDWVRSTTPANTFDVSATGEGGLDFNNIKQASGVTTLNNITIPTVTDVTTKTGFALSAAGIDSIIDEVIEGTLTFRQGLRLMFAVLFGKSTGGGTASVQFRDNADLINRVNATVDASGNRSGITLNGS
jgi:hypothetical protein